MAGVKAFLGSSTGSLLLDKEEMILAALKCGRRRLAVHSEDEARLRARAKLARAYLDPAKVIIPVQGY